MTKKESTATQLCETPEKDMNVCTKCQPYDNAKEKLGDLQSH